VLHPSASVGVTVAPVDGTVASQLLRNADLAMYAAKEQGGNTHRFYSPSMDPGVHARASLADDLHLALERGELLLHYQPQVALLHGEVVGLEALLRWQHPTRGLVLPEAFLQVAEEAGLMQQVGDWALRQACLQNRAWQQAGFSPLPVAVNVLPSQFVRKELFATVCDALAESGLPTRWLELEVTESALIRDHRRSALTLRRLRQRGIHVALDDFGTGYSSLSYLARLPVSKLKIDRSFVRDLVTDPSALAVARMIIDLGHTLGLRVLAEGVETAAQADALRANGCDDAQGYHFWPALPVESMTELMEKEMRSRKVTPDVVA
jgi:EAL domain-containing protein (putative c-di-GMP-specific phosphodiesterase class I)